jgi:hypothetical protein
MNKKQGLTKICYSVVIGEKNTTHWTQALQLEAGRGLK